MYKNRSEYTSGKLRYQLLTTLVMVSIVCLTLLGLAGYSPVAYADGIPGGNVSDPVVRAVDIAKPAVVRIFTNLGGHLTVHFSATQNATFPQGGGAYPLTLS